MVNERQRLLAAFLCQAAAAPHQWGEWDCAMTVANWARVLTGTDPAPHLRGTYHGIIGWRHIVEEAGGLVPLFDGIATGIGAVRIETPRPGDFGIVRIEGLDDGTGAICTGMGWAMKLNRGLTIGPARHVAAWAIHA